LALDLLAPPALQAIAEGRLDEASRLAECDLTGFPEAERGIAAIRLKDLAADPDYMTWSLRLLRLKPDLRFAGYFNFHTRPDPDYLRELAPGAVELGYYVLPDFRRRKIGERMLVSIFARAEKLGAEWLTLEVRASNLAAQRLYEKYGFRPAGIRRRYYSDNNEDAIIMWTERLRDRSVRDRLAKLRSELEDQK